MQGTIEIQNEGTPNEVIFVRYETNWSHEPVHHTMWWRVDRVTRDAYSPRWPKTGDVVTSNGTNYWRGLGFEVWFPGDRECERSETRPIPCPKVRAGIETRWNRYEGGRWEKLLKRGWVPA